MRITFGFIWDLKKSGRRQLQPQPLNFFLPFFFLNASFSRLQLSFIWCETPPLRQNEMSDGKEVPLYACSSAVIVFP